METYKNLKEKRTFENSWLKADQREGEALSDIFQCGTQQKIKDCVSFIECVLQQSLSPQEYQMLVQVEFSKFEADLTASLEHVIASKEYSLGKIILMLQGAHTASLYFALPQRIEYLSTVELCSEKRLPFLLEGDMGVVAGQYFLLRICQYTRDVMAALACPYVFCVRWGDRSGEVVLAASGTAYCPQDHWFD